MRRFVGARSPAKKGPGAETEDLEISVDALKRANLALVRAQERTHRVASLDTQVQVSLINAALAANDLDARFSVGVETLRALLCAHGASIAVPPASPSVVAASRPAVFTSEAAFEGLAEAHEQVVSLPSPTSAAAHQQALAYDALGCKLSILPRNASLAIVSSLIDPLECDTMAVVFDFDQTISCNALVDGKRVYGLRGSDSAMKFLFELRAHCVERFIVTGAPPTVPSVQTIAQTLQRLGVAAVFDVAPVDWLPVITLLGSWGPDSTLEAAKLETKAAVLLLLCTQRFAPDLARIGLSNAVAAADSFAFRLASTGGGADDWSALQRLSGASVPAAFTATLEHLSGQGVCATLETFVVTRAAAAGASTPDRLFAADIVERVQELFAAAGLDNADAALKLSDPAQTATIADGVRIARLQRIVASAYNKPEAIQHLLETRAPHTRSLLFIDDNSDNVFKVFLHFADLARHGVTHNLSVHCVWFPPPAGGKDEDHSADFRAELTALACAWGTNLEWNLDALAAI